MRLAGMLEEFGLYGIRNLFAIYANPHAHIRDNVWPIIKSRCSNTEQRGGCHPNLQHCCNFKSWINDCGLIDVVPAGPFFTWEGPKRQGQRKLYKRLDRVLCNQNWRSEFPDASTRCLIRINSDHHPLLVSMEDMGPNAHNRPFRFENCWMQHEKFTEFLKQEWEVFGDIPRRKRRLLNRINGIQAAIDRKYNPFLERLGRELEKELETVLNQEEALWFQKARCQWIRDGDRNTRYYHTKTISHRRRNKILMLKDNSGNWTEDLEEIKKITVNFYKELFKEDSDPTNCPHPEFKWPVIEDHVWDSINVPFSPDEIKIALFNIGSTKAPGSLVESERDSCH
ncbi:ribonuclease H [Senna tora]|uniref:Ribonuclease H n=1 Tax=Senna tora TaxID=362788 RepID=A0A834WHW1_9FABA|nr:ribonuclease H [Senna tora]